MSAFNDFVTQLETTDVIRQLLKSLKEEPAHLLADICAEYQATGQAVPEHRLHPGGYMEEVALRALLSLGLTTRQAGTRLAIYAYVPTPAGLERYDKLKAEGFYEGRQWGRGA